MGKLYVGNLSWNTTEDSLKQHFSSCGDVISAKIITDRETGKSRGFAFVEMDNSNQAIIDLNDKELEGRRLKISEARERQPRPRY